MQQALASTDLLTRTLILVNLLSFVSCITSSYHVQIYSLIDKTRPAKTIRRVNLSYCFVIVEIWIENEQEKLSTGMCAFSRFDDLIIEWEERKKENGERRSSMREGELGHFTFISIHCNRDQQKNMMIDSRYRWQNTNARQSSDPMIIAIRLCIHTRFFHTTRKCRAVCAVNSIDYAYNFLFLISFIFNFLFTHHMELKYTWLWSVIHANRYLHGHYRKKEKKGLCVFVGGISIFFLFK